MKKRQGDQGEWKLWPGETFTVTQPDGFSSEYPRYVEFRGETIDFQDLERRVQAGDAAARAIWPNIIEQVYRVLVVRLAEVCNDLRRRHGQPDDITPEQVLAAIDSNGGRELSPDWAQPTGYDEHNL